ncbi:MAG TPA: PilZ domain-containing protein [Myxococcota bacterium]|jgi:CheY-like chemotaxis protein
MNPGARPRILVVDDVPLFREVEALYLARIGDVSVASCAAEARAILARESVDVALLDLHLPDQAGDALCREYLAANAARTRFVLITRGAAEEHARAVAAGAADILVKPLSRADLVGSVTRLLGDPRGQPRAALREPAHFWAKDRVSTGTVHNISRGGAFVSAGWLPREGSDLVVEFALPGEARAIAAPARVVWRRQSLDSGGFGVRFVALDGRAQRSLTQYIEEHTAPALSPAGS